MNLRSFTPLLACLITLLSACALTYQNEDRRGTLGFAWIEYRVEDAGKKDSALRLGKETIDQVPPVVQQKTLGLYLDTSRDTAGIGFGYRDVVIVVPAENAESHVEYDTADPLSSHYIVEKQEDR